MVGIVSGAKHGSVLRFARPPSALPGIPQNGGGAEGGLEKRNTLLKLASTPAPITTLSGSCGVENGTDFLKSNLMIGTRIIRTCKVTYNEQLLLCTFVYKQECMVQKP